MGILVAVTALALLQAPPASPPAAPPVEETTRTVDFRVTGEKGAPVEGLTADEVVVMENGTARSVLRVQRDTRPLTVAILVDTSAPQATNLRLNIVKAVGTFVRKPLERRFYETFAPRALERGWLRLFAIRARERFLAVQVGYAYRSSFLQLQEGFDPEAPSGIGNVLRARVIERCIEEGLTTYDFLGDHTEHKRRWSAQARDGFDLLIWRPTLKNRLATSLPLWPTGRYLRAQGVPPDGFGAPA